MLLVRSVEHFTGRGCEVEAERPDYRRRLRFALRDQARKSVDAHEDDEPSMDEIVKTLNRVLEGPL